MIFKKLETSSEATVRFKSDYICKLDDEIVARQRLAPYICELRTVRVKPSLSILESPITLSGPPLDDYVTLYLSLKELNLKTNAEQIVSAATAPRITVSRIQGSPANCRIFASTTSVLIHSIPPITSTVWNKRMTHGLRTSRTGSNAADSKTRAMLPYLKKCAPRRSMLNITGKSLMKFI